MALTGVLMRRRTSARSRATSDVPCAIGGRIDHQERRATAPLPRGLTDATHASSGDADRDLDAADRHDGRGSIPIAARPPASPLDGQIWVLRSYLAEDGGYTGTESPATIRFDAEASGSTGCNDFQGPWSVDGAHLAIGPLVYTARACTSTGAGQDTAVRASLAEIAGYQVSGNADLDLLDASGDIRLSYRTWRAHLGAAHPGDQPTPAGVVTLAFLDGIVSGQAPCNQFSGPTSWRVPRWPSGHRTTQLDLPRQGARAGTSWQSSRPPRAGRSPTATWC